MDVDYKEHHIIASAWHNPDGWKPRLHIVWSESVPCPCADVKTFVLTREHRTLPGEGLAIYDHSLKDILRVRYGYTDHHARSSIAETGAWTFPVLN